MARHEIDIISGILNRDEDRHYCLLWHRMPEKYPSSSHDRTRGVMHTTLDEGNW